MTQKILVIEDEQSVLHNTLEILSLEGFDAVGANNGHHGVEQAREHRPDLIICDIMMPEMNGYEVLAELRSTPETSLTPFIFLTARTERKDMRQGMNLGADDYLTKPFTVVELLESVQARLGKSTTIADKAEEKLEALRENIILSMPHELRTPLTSILGFSDIIVMDGLNMPPEQIVKMATHINTSAIRLSRLIENYLTYAQIEIIKLDTRRQDDLMKYNTNNAKIIIDNKAYQVATTAHRESDLMLQVDPAAIKMQEDYLKKVVEEVVDNAFKFSDPGSPVVVTGGPSNGMYTFSVQDQGRGMTSQQIDEVGAYMQFDRSFYEQQGAGLGLVIARRLTELHGGSLTIESTPRQQTTVTVNLLLC